MEPVAELCGPIGSRFSRIAHVEQTDSTNADLLSIARTGNLEPAALMADHQRGGRGRQGRAWFDEPGSSLLISYLVPFPAAIASLLPLATGLAALDSIEPASVMLKWPNDVLVADDTGRKLAGILAESVLVGDRLAVTVGMGMNLLSPSRPVPSEVAERMVSLSELIGPSSWPESIERDALAVRYLDAVERYLKLLEAGRADEVIEEYRRRCETIGRRVRFQLGVPGTASEIVGEAVNIASDGRLIVVDDAGRSHHLMAGDAHHLPNL